MAVYTVNPAKVHSRAAPVIPAFTLHEGPILGISTGDVDSADGIYWSRISDPSCGWGDLTGEQLKQEVFKKHQAHMHVLLLTCQDDHGVLNQQRIEDAARADADAVQCGNEQVKFGPGPEQFAIFYDDCELTVHAIKPDIPVLMGALDPKIGGEDFGGSSAQAKYFNAMEIYMNTTLHYNGAWHWRNQIIGLIDSWHNGFPDPSTNSLKGLFDYWAKAFQVPTNELGKHVWVVEGTGCFTVCGLNEDSPADIATSHIYTLISDVQTSLHYNVPFFYFSNRDFFSVGHLWPIGVRDIDGNPKPLRQDLALDDRALNLSCGSITVTVRDQVHLLARMYQGCTVPDNYMDILAS